MRRIVLLGLGGVFMALLVAACGSGGSESQVTLGTTSDVSSSSVCEETPVSGGSLVYARSSESLSLNPLEIKNGNGDIFTDEMIYTGLVRLDPEGGDDIVPALAKSWDVSSDGKTYTFHLRPGIKFSDGSPVTAEDVAWSLNNFGDPKINELMAILATGYKHATVVDSETVKIELSEPIAAFLYNVAEFPAFILPKDKVESEGEAFFKHPIGAGPFMVKEFVPGDHISLEKNPNYWEKGKPYLGSLRFNFTVDDNTRVLALRSGEAQIADAIPYGQIPSIQNDAELTLQTASVPAWSLLSLNLTEKPLDDPQIREALQYALNRDEINKVVYKGVGSIPNSLFGELKFDDPSIEGYEFDPEKAKELIAKSESPDGFDITLQYPAGFSYLKQTALLVQQYWSAIGVNVKLEEEAAAAAHSRWNEMDYQATFPFPVVTSDVPVPDEFAGFYADPESGTEGFFTGWENAEIAKKVETFQTTPDEEARAEQWPVIQRELLEENPSINVMDVPFVNAHGVNVCGTAINALGVDHLELTWLPASS